MQTGVTLRTGTNGYTNEIYLGIGNDCKAICSTQRSCRVRQCAAWRASDIRMTDLHLLTSENYLVV